MIRFAGVELLMPSEKLEAFVSRFIPPRREIIFGDPQKVYAGDLPVTPWPDPPPLALNTLYWPTGATRWAQGIFLADGDAKRQIVTSVTDSGRVIGYRSAILELSDGDYEGGFLDGDGGWNQDQKGRVLLSTKMFLLPPRPVTIVSGEEPDTVWLMPLVDERYFWRNHTNAGSGEESEEEAEEGESESDPLEDRPWSDVFDELGKTLGIMEDIRLPSEIESAWGVAPGSGACSADGLAAPRLDLAAANIGRRVVREFDGRVEIQSPQEATDLVDSATDRWARVAGSGEYFPSGIVAVPESVEVLFRESGIRLAPMRESVLFSDLVAGGPDHDAEGPTLPMALPNPDDVATLWTSMCRLPNPEQEDAVSDAAKALARVFYAWRGKEYDIAFASVKEWPLTGFDDAVEFAFRRDAILTRVWTIPPGHELVQLASCEPTSVFVKADQAVSKGILSSGNVFSVWTGPAKGAGSVDTGVDIKGDYAFGDFEEGEYGLAVKRGCEWYIECLGCGGGETTSIATLQEGFRPVISGDPGNPVCDALIGAEEVEVDFTLTDWQIPISAGTKVAVQSGPGPYTPVGLIPDLANGIVVSHTTDGHSAGVDTYTVRITYKTDMSSGTSTVDLTVRSWVEPKLINTTLGSNTGVLVGRNHEGEWGIVNAGCA